MKRFKQLNVVVVPATSEYQTTTKYGGTDYIARTWLELYLQP